MRCALKDQAQLPLHHTKRLSALCAPVMLKTALCSSPPTAVTLEVDCEAASSGPLSNSRNQEEFCLLGRQREKEETELYLDSEPTVISPERNSSGGDALAAPTGVAGDAESGGGGGCLDGGGASAQRRESSGLEVLDDFLFLALREEECAAKTNMSPRSRAPYLQRLAGAHKNAGVGCSGQSPIRATLNLRSLQLAASRRAALQEENKTISCTPAQDRASGRTAQTPEAEERSGAESMEESLESSAARGRTLSLAGCHLQVIAPLEHPSPLLDPPQARPLR